MKNQDKTSEKPIDREELEPWETRLSLGSYLKHLSNGETEDVPHVEKTGLDPSQDQSDR